MKTTDLVGARSLVTDQLVVNSNMPTGTKMTAAAGYLSLGIHQYLRLALEDTAGIPAYQEWIRDQYAAYSVFHNNKQIGELYSVQDLSDYYVWCWLMDFAFTEAQRDLKMMDWNYGLDFEAGRDFWGASFDQIVANRQNKTTYCNRLNGLADYFYVHYPFPKLTYTEYVRGLLDKVYRDDSDRRTNFIYFHLLFDPNTDNLFDVFTTMFSTIEGLLQGESSMPRLIGDMKLNYIISDIRQLFGEKVNQSLPLMTGLDAPIVEYAPDLIAALNQSRVGAPNIAYFTNTGGSATYAHILATEANMNWTWATTPGNWAIGAHGTSYNTGLYYGPGYTGSWTAALPVTFNDLARLCNDGPNITLYGDFSGEKVLANNAFTTICRWITSDTSSGVGVFDPDPDFTHTSGNVLCEMMGMFGFHIWKTGFNYVAAHGTSTGGLVQVSQYNIVGLGQAVTQNVPAFIPIYNAGASAYVIPRDMSRNIANSVDAVTTWEVTRFSGGDVQIVSDEDMDEFGTLEWTRLMNTYSSTVRGMFIPAMAVVKQSNRVDPATLSPKSSAITTTKRSGGKRYGKPGKNKNQKR